jgi:hypothetical protein
MGGAGGVAKILRHRLIDIYTLKLLDIYRPGDLIRVCYIMPYDQERESIDEIYEYLSNALLLSM